MSLQSTLIKQISALEKERNEINKRMSDAPEGKLVIYHCKNQKRYYQVKKDFHNKKAVRKEIYKDNHELAEKLAVKAYYSARLKSIENKLCLYRNILNLAENTEDPAAAITGNPDYYDLIRPYYKSDAEKFAEWVSSEYNKNARHPESLSINTPHGKVRSKSEYIIFSELDKYHLFARYECLLKVGNTELYPDFMIRHPATGELFIWEHLGLMDNPEYIESFTKKLNTYAAAGYYLGINLIITTETAQHPLDVNFVDTLIEYYFTNI